MFVFNPLYTAGVCLFHSFNRKQLHYTPSDDHIKSIQWIEARDRVPGALFPFFFEYFFNNSHGMLPCTVPNSKAE